MLQLGPKSRSLFHCTSKRLLFFDLLLTLSQKRVNLVINLVYLKLPEKKTSVFFDKQTKKTYKKHCGAVCCHSKKAKLIYQPWARYADMFLSSPPNKRSTMLQSCIGITGSPAWFFGLAQRIQVFKRVWGSRQRQWNKSDTPISLFVNHPLPTRKSLRRLFKDGRQRHSPGLIGCFFIVDSFDYWFHTAVISSKFT